MVSHQPHQGITSERGHKSSFSAKVSQSTHALLLGGRPCLTVHMSRQVAVPLHVTEVPRRVVQRRTPPSTFPEGSREQLDQVDLTDFFLLRLPMLKSCPHFLRTRLRESFGVALAERHRAKSVGDEMGESRAWKLFGLVPAMLWYRPRCAGSIGRDDLARRADQFAAGRWIDLLNQARQTGTRMSRLKTEAGATFWEVQKKLGYRNFFGIQNLSFWKHKFLVDRNPKTSQKYKK